MCNKCLCDGTKVCAFICHGRKIISVCSLTLTLMHVYMYVPVSILQHKSAVTYLPWIINRQSSKFKCKAIEFFVKLKGLLLYFRSILKLMEFQMSALVCGLLKIKRFLAIYSERIYINLHMDILRIHICINLYYMPFIGAQKSCTKLKEVYSC